VREDHVASEKPRVARVFGGAHAVEVSEQGELLRRLREVRGENAAEIVRSLAALAQKLREAGIGCMRPDRDLPQAFAAFVARPEECDRFLKLRETVVAEVPYGMAVGSEPCVRRRHDERRADGAKSQLVRDIEKDFLPVVPHVEDGGRAAFHKVDHAERGDGPQLIRRQLLRREPRERQQDVVDELRDERLHLEVVGNAAEEAAADAMRVQIDEAGCNKAVLVAEYLLPGCGRVPRDGFDRRAIDVHVMVLEQDLSAVSCR
jgi:hypothetical protein